jgi:3-hydroxymyristoyl/3-hydroxydecanoyl-(acyl carrier protein) dehydratase
MKDMGTERQEVLDTIPHHHPFLFVDKILNLREDAIEVGIIIALELLLCQFLADY